MKLDTVNVISISLETGHIEALHSFPDNEDGNKKAEAKFTDKCGKLFIDWKDLDPEDIEDIISDGNYEGNHIKVLLIHSD